VKKWRCKQNTTSHLSLWAMRVTSLT
ncbi:gram-negative porin family protein, partial [Vibrio parahaemolyticus V-223/04]